jgi:bacterial/archaeal transporter family-2 protein
VSAGTAITVGILFVAGLAGAVQVAVMGELGERVGIAAAVAFAAAVTLLCALVALLAVERGFSGVRAGLGEPVWLWLGGVMSLLIVFAITLGAPRVGTAATIGLVIAGNLLMAAVIDRFGLFGQDAIPLAWPRLLGIALLAIGAGLSLSQT